jgi:hypothetical protein
MKPSLRNIKKKTPLIAKKVGAVLAAISSGIGAIGYASNLDIYVHIGAICLILSILLPNLFADGTVSKE